MSMRGESEGAVSAPQDLDSVRAIAAPEGYALRSTFVPAHAARLGDPSGERPALSDANIVQA